MTSKISFLKLMQEDAKKTKLDAGIPYGSFFRMLSGVDDDRAGQYDDGK